VSLQDSAIGTEARVQTNGKLQLVPSFFFLVEGEEQSPPRFE